MCGSCGQKYRGLSSNRAHKQLIRYRRLRGGKREVIPPLSQKNEVAAEPPVTTEEKKDTPE